MIYFLLREGSILFCPNCNNELIVVERDKVELDYCLSCNGFWFDNKEWDLLVERLQLRDNKPIGDLYSIPKVFVKEGQKSCPCCNAKMEKFLAYNIILDRCPNHHGVWFDKGEISRLFNRDSSDTKGTPMEFLGEVFYK